MRLYILHVHPKNASEMCFAGWVRRKTRNFATSSFAGRRQGAAHFFDYLLFSSTLLSPLMLRNCLFSTARRWVSLAVLVLFPALLQAQTTVVGTIRSGGLLREYRLYVPAIYTRTTGPVPLLFNLHGYGSNNIEQEAYGDFRPIADTANFLVVHPNGSIDAANKRNWNTFGPRGTGIDDVAFLSALLDTLATRYRIDPDRVYSTGMSNGGFMSYELACQLSGRIAAVGSVTGSMIGSRMASCAPGRPVPVIEIHGTADGTVPYTGGPPLNFVAIPSLLAHWVRVNGCNPTPTITAVPDVNTTDGCTAERQLWTGGRNGSTVEHFRIIGGGHTWPGAAFTTGVTNRDISASREVWRFLRPYRLSRLVLAARGSTAAPTLTLYPNPAADELTIRANQPLRAGSLAVFGTLGRHVPARALPQPDGSLRLTTSGWPAGTYILRVETANGQSQQLKFVKP